MQHNGCSKQFVYELINLILGILFNDKNDSFRDISAPVQSADLVTNLCPNYEKIWGATIFISCPVTDKA